MIPEAKPVSLGETSLSAASSKGLKAIPVPSPSKIMLGSTWVSISPSTGAFANNANPVVPSAKPTANGLFTPYRVTSLADIPSANAAVMTFAGT